MPSVRPPNLPAGSRSCRLTMKSGRYALNAGSFIVVVLRGGEWRYAAWVSAANTAATSQGSVRLYGSLAINGETGQLSVIAM
jgi:hypothetical protein